MIRRITNSRLVVALAAALFASCGFLGSDFTWDEDVQLSDGSVIRVHRRTEYAKTLSPAGGPVTGILKSASVQIVKSGIPETASWNMKLYPIHVDRDPGSGLWVIVAELAGVEFSGNAICDLWNRHGRPQAAEVAFVYKGGWVQAPVPEYLVGKKVNLMPGVPREDAALVTVSTKEKWLTSRGFPWPVVHSEDSLNYGRAMSSSCERYLRTTGKW